MRGPIDNIINNLIRSYPNSTFDIYAYVDDANHLTNLTLEPNVIIRSILTDYTDPGVTRLRSNSQKMFYRMKILQEVADSIQQSVPAPDIVVRIRPDTIFKERAVLRVSDKLSMVPTISIPISRSPRAVTDIFFFGPMDLMRRLNSIYESYRLSGCMNPELYLLNYLTAHNLPYVFDCKNVVTLRAHTIDSFSLNLAKQLGTIRITLSEKGCNIPKIY